MSDEVWRDVVGYEGRYQVSSLGRVKSLARLMLKGNRWGKICPVRVRERILKPQPKNVYWRQVFLHDGDVQKSFAVHQLVLEAFVGPKPEGFEGRHRDNDGSNNALSNLSWSTHADNMDDQYVFGTRARGSRHGLAVLTEELVHEIKTRLATRVRGDMARIAREYGLRETEVARIMRGERWSHV